MSDKPIDQRVKDIIVEQLGVKPEQVVPAAKFIEDLGADSLDTVELVMALEEEFGIEVPDDQAEKLQSVGAEVFDELGRRNDLFGFDAELFDDDIFYALFDWFV